MVRSQLPTPKTPSAKVIDLFCGIGGLSYGFAQSGFEIAGGIDFDASCETTYTSNIDAQFLVRDLANCPVFEIDELFEGASVKILVGCAPCQPFSVYNNKIKKEVVADHGSKWQLLYNFADIIEATKPDVISMENVPQLLRFNSGKVFTDFKARLEGKGYAVSHYVIDAKDYGVPQRRKRLVLFGSSFGSIKLIDPPMKDKPVTVRQAIGHLPRVEGGPSHPKDPLHRARKLSDLNIRRIQATPEGGFWRDWDESLKLECHKKDSGISFRSVYGRMRWDEVSPTITTYCIGLGNGRFGHPEQDRAITLREAAILQGFPCNYNFPVPGQDASMQTIARHIGNAVPVGLSAAIAESIKIHLEEVANQTNATADNH